ncbi:zf-HC2 domain-containing protein [Peribacillus sp. JNUCC 23]|uniref:zf-HC2 domain-containing protein n=1 Tax=Peribacillus sp. NPDC096379 TaxID=3364393 RepID=UPI003825EB2E
MKSNQDCAVFQDLYELYVDCELEPETMEWMREHEMGCQHCLNENQTKIENVTFLEDFEKIKTIRILTVLLYGSFAVLSLWMSVWYFW